MTSQISQSEQNQASGLAGKATRRGVAAGRVADNGPATSATLLGRLQHWDDTAAWRSFVDRYQGLLDSWSHKKLPNPSDVDDLNQQVVWEVARRLTSFRYDSKRSFRGWLRTLHQSRLLDFLKIQRRRQLREIEVARLRRPHDLVDMEPASETYSEGLHSETSFTDSPRLGAVLSSVQARVTPQTWSIFRDVAVHSQSVADTARRHGISYSAAFAAYSRTCQMLRREVETQGVTLPGTIE